MHAISSFSIVFNQFGIGPPSAKAKQKSRIRQSGYANARNPANKKACLCVDFL